MNQILEIINDLQKRSDYEQEHKEELLENRRMLAITKETGKFYNQILKATKAKRVLEIGLSHGYSTLWFADAILSNYESIPPAKSIITIENDESKIKIAKENFKKASVLEFIEIKEGNGIKVLNEILSNFKKSPQKNYFDFAFIDADKENSIKYFELCFPMIKEKGIIAADNILDMKEMEAYSNYVKNRKNVETVTLPIGWGQEFSIKLKA